MRMVFGLRGLPPILAVCVPLGVCAQAPGTLAELQPLSPVVLTRDDLLALLPGARMRRVNDKGNTHHWVNETGGEMVVSSDNRSEGRPSTAAARWHIDELGRYCLSVRWKRGPEEQSCRHLVRTTQGYFSVEAVEPLTRKVQQLDIGR